jgi:hypothetical protein
LGRWGFKFSALLKKLRASGFSVFARDNFFLSNLRTPVILKITCFLSNLPVSEQFQSSFMATAGVTCAAMVANRKTASVTNQQRWMLRRTSTSDEQNSKLPVTVYFSDERFASQSVQLWWSCSPPLYQNIQE